jgi:tetrahydromethanopterin S-methyltransferase subunit H
MTKKQKARARALLAKDCKISNRYYDAGKTCAIGCLAVASGVSVKLLEAAVARIDSEYTSSVKIARAIKRKFGMSVEHMDSIQRANDSWTKIPARRRAVLAKLDSFPTKG